MKLIYLIPFLLITSAFAKPCGLEGTIDERIKDCAQTKGNFVLVQITEKGQEIYKDLKSGIIWGGRITSDFNHYGSQRACSDEVAENPNLNSKKWRLPTIREFEEAASHGMKAALPNTQHSYWSSTPVKVKSRRRRNARPAMVFIWDGFQERTDTGDLKDAASVRCVIKE
jgi:predicted class III extradiol MEMO1 family dioxygenase